jgi:hypothetical protein
MDDNNKVAVVAILGVVGLITLLAGYTFLTDHWEDIKAMATIALISGGTFSVAFAGFKIHSRR